MNAKKGFEDFLAFIKTFDDNQFGDIYAEREWRAIESFHFDYDDIPMIVIPRTLDGGNYYKRFLEQVPILRLPRSVPIVAWEDLIEH
jgi:Putative abortive phage resistance protein AbiGi, antitoxin